MSLQEYFVPNDYFQCHEIKHSDEFDFPCCVCRNKEHGHLEYPCKYCGHNHAQVGHFSCPLCGEIQDGDFYKDGKVIANGTNAIIRGVCQTCYNIIKKDMTKNN